jgi:hypothetical protein
MKKFMVFLKITILNSGIIFFVFSLIYLIISEKPLITESGTFFGKNRNKLEQEIKKTTVIIQNNSDLSSGIIIGRELNDSKPNIYYVLTASHNVNNPPSKIKVSKNEYYTICNKEKLKNENYERKDENYERKDENYEFICYEGLYYVTTDDGEKHLVNYEEIIDFSEQNVDLAIIAFKSSKTYKPANLYTEKIDNTILSLISAYKPCTNKPEYEFNQGQTYGKTGMNKAISKLYNFVNGKYNIYYSNSTVKGMSGGGLFNKDGHLIAIHGRTDNPDKNYNYQSCPSLNNQSENFGDNWGISLYSFLELDFPQEIKDILPKPLFKSRKN